jgi:exosortase B
VNHPGTAHLGGVESLWRAAPEWLPVLLGLAVLYLPTLTELNRSFWHEDEHAHGPILLLAAAWMFWQKRRQVGRLPGVASTAAGGALLAAGLVCYVVGRSQALIALEAGSAVLTVSATLLLMRGWAALRMLLFPVLFLACLVPLPGIVINPLTGFLQQLISSLTELILYELGYPIARSGVVLNIGSYRLLVAEACSGITSIFSLSALGLLYVHLANRANPLRNAALLAAVVPVAVAANLLRVLILVLVTYHFGAAAGQGAVHDFSGIALFASALLFLLGIDVLLGKVMPRRQGRS